MAEVWSTSTAVTLSSDHKKLFICFKKNQQAIADIFNEGLKKIDAAKIQADYLAGLK